MKHKLFLLIGFLIISLTSQAQWVNKLVDNSIDEPYRISYCYDIEKVAVLKLEKIDTMVAFYLSGGYHCDEYPTVDIGLTVNGQVKRYSFEANTSGDRRTVFMIDDLYDASMVEFLADFKKCSKLSMRINESHCQDDYYVFNMSGSTWALKYISQ